MNLASGGQAGKAFGIGAGAIIAVCALLLMLFIYCRRARKFQRVIYRKPPSAIVETQLIRDVPPPQNQVVMVQETAPRQPVVVRPVQTIQANPPAQPVIVRTTMQPTTRPLIVSEQPQPTTIVSTNGGRPSYVVASPIKKSSPVVLFKKR